MDRPTRACRLCKRLLFWDHGFQKRNFNAHERACAQQSDDQRSRATTRARKAAERPKPKRRKGSKNQLELLYPAHDPKEPEETS